MALWKREELELKVEGMTCGNCVAHVTKALEGVKGVKRAQVDLEQGQARVEAKEGTAAQDLVRAVREAGYEASVAA